MNIKTLKNYIEKCNSHNVIPTLKGAVIYKRFGVAEGKPEGFCGAIWNLNRKQITF